MVNYLGLACGLMLTRGSNIGVLVGKYKSKARLVRALGQNNKRTWQDKHKERKTTHVRACVGNTYNIS